MEVQQLEEIGKAKAYWDSRFSRETGTTSFPVDNHIAGREIFHFDFDLDADISAKLIKIADGNDIRIQICLMAGVISLLYRYDGGPTLAIGTPMYRQNEENAINTFLLFFSDFKNDKTFKQLIIELSKEVKSANLHQNFPLLTYLTQRKLVDRVTGHSPFDVFVGLSNVQSERSPEGLLPGIFFNFTRVEDKFNGRVSFDGNQFKVQSIQRYVTHLKRLLSCCLSNPDKKIFEIDLLSDLDREITANKVSDQSILSNTDFIRLFASTAAKFPGNKAICTDSTGMTYEELDQLSTKLSNYLIEACGVRRDDLVGIMLERSEWVAISILAILKSGCGFVPIDLSYPGERIAYILKDSNCSYCIDQDKINSFIASANFNKMKASGDAVREISSIAYVLYTSGSTGLPKGVIIEQPSILNYLLWANEYYFNNANGYEFAFFTSLSFDLTLTSILSTLLRGDAINIITDNEAGSMLAEIFYEKKTINTVKLTPSHLNVLKYLPARPTAIEIVILGGEPVTVENVRFLRSLNKDIRIFNEYGPTETTVGCTCFEIKTEEALITIGKPISNASIVIADKHFSPMPVGIMGEILIGGPGVAKGYVNLDHLTSEKFINIHRGNEQVSRYYRSGDLGRWLPDGNIEYLGRIDDQVKIHGFRIETGEIENSVMTHDSIREACVIIKKTGTETELVLYYIADEKLNPGVLRQFLGKKLPEFMIPGYFVQLNEFPLTPNGKTDKKKLAENEQYKIQFTNKYKEPSNDIERRLCSIWESVLGINNIGVDDDFFDLGGHSLKATRLISYYKREFGVSVSLKEIFINSTISSQAKIIAGSARSTHSDIEPVSSKENYPLSNAQLRLWLINQHKTPVSYNIPAVFRISGMIDRQNLCKAFVSVIDRHEILRTYFKEDENGDVRQWIVPKGKHNIGIQFFDCVDHPNKKSQIKKLVDEHQTRSFDLSSLPLISLLLIREETDKHILAMNIHHIICDGWSMEILVHDLLKYYSDYCKGVQDSLPGMRIQYKDYSNWMAARLSGSFFEESKKYWLEKFAGTLSFFDLSGYDTHAKINADKGVYTLKLDHTSVDLLKTISRSGGASLFAGLLSAFKGLIYRYTGSGDVIVGILGAGREHIDLEDQVGFYVNTLPVRTRLSGDMSFDGLLSEVTSSLMHACRYQLFPFDKLVEELNLKNGNSRRPVFNVAVGFNESAFIKADTWLPAGVEISTMPSPESESKFDLDLTFVSGGAGVTLVIKYNTKKYSRDFAVQLCNDFNNFLKYAINNPQTTIEQNNFLNENRVGNGNDAIVASKEGYSLPGGVPGYIYIPATHWPAGLEAKYAYSPAGTIESHEYGLLYWTGDYGRLIPGGEIEWLKKIPSADEEINSLVSGRYISRPERFRMLDEFNPDVSDYELDETVVSLFRKQVDRTPQAIAVVYEDREVTYKELDERSNQLGHYLQSKGVTTESLVPVCVEKGVEMIVAILGIMKAGGAYVPIDPSYPAGRISYMLSDTKANVVLCDEASRDKLSEESGAEVTVLERDWKVISEKPMTSLNVKVTSGQLAYIIYTSGSTGNPKGVMVEHRNGAGICKAWRKAYDLDDFEVRLLQLASFSFDVFFGDVCKSLLIGGTMVICPDQTKFDFRELYLLIKKYRINFFETTPGYAIPLINYIEKEGLDLQDMRILVIGSENVNASWYEHMHATYGSAFRVVNSYGTTEATVDSMYFEGEIKTDIARTGNGAPIGKPYPNTLIYILDENRNLQPAGIPGEIYIGGPGVARGYLNRPELTAERFIKNPFTDGRMYRTGDLGCLNLTGSVEYLGRADDQVKIRGYRIETGEIETALLKDSSVSACVVVAKNYEEGDKFLCAYVVGSNAGQFPDKAELRSRLKSILPEYMVPSVYVLMERLPLTSNGKIDKNNLPLPDIRDIELPLDNYSPPRNNNERHLVAVFEEVLGHKPIGIWDDFFALGGDSINSIQVVARIRAKGYQLQVKDVLRNPRIADLSERLAPLTRYINQDVVTGDIIPGPIQARFLESNQPGKHHYNQSVFLFTKGTVPADGLKLILSELVKHHDALRIVFEKINDQWVEKNLGLSQEFYFEEADLTAKNNWEELLAEICDELHEKISLEKGPLLRAGLYHCPGGDRILLVIHHLVVDGVSWRILLEDLSSLYKQYINKQEFKLQLKTDSFRSWQEKLLMYSESEAIQKEVSYWNTILCASTPGLKKDKEGGSNLNKDTDIVTFNLGRELTSSLLTETHIAWRTDINDVLLTALAIAIKDVFDVDEIKVGLEGHGREDIGSDIDVSRTVGWFTTEFPVLLNISSARSVQDCLIQIKEHLHRVPGKGIGHGALRYMGSRPLDLEDEYIEPAITFNYLGDFSSGLTKQAEDIFFDFAGGYGGLACSPNQFREEELLVTGIILTGELKMSIAYSREQYQSSTIQKLVDSYENNLTGLIKLLRSTGTPTLTPVDLTYKGLNTDELGTINRDGMLEDVYTLSPLQEGMYYHWLSDNQSPAYFEQVTYRIIDPNLDIEALRKSYNYMVNRHPILRTLFTMDYGLPLQLVRKEATGDGFSYHEVFNDPSFTVDAWCKNDRQQGFDLHSWSQMRLSVLYHGHSEYSFAWSSHHILMDGWCVGVIIREFFEVYRNFLGGQMPLLPKIQPYVNYIEWLKKVDKNITLKYWNDYLSGYDMIAGLPVQGLPGAEMADSAVIVEGKTLSRLRKLCAQLGITENTILQSAWGILLSKYNSTKDVVFGCVVSGRPSELDEVESMIGLFINTIPVRVRYDDTTIVSELLRKIQKESIESIPHHYVQLAEVQSSHELGSGLLDHIMVFENYPVQDRAKENSGDESKHLDIVNVEAFEQSNYLLALKIVPRKERLTINFRYNRDLYGDRFMSEIGEHLLCLVETIVSDHQQRLDRLDYMSKKEKDFVLGFNPDVSEYELNETVVSLFEKQVNRKPGSIAVVYEDRELTYKELDERSNQLGHYLQSKGVTTESLVPVCVEKSIEMIVAILGIMKAGGAYVPIDPSYPSARISYMLSDTKAGIVVCDEASRNKLSEESGAEVIVLERDWKIISEKPVTSLNVEVAPGQLAYIIYTSGSTGNPKGVMVEHRNGASICKAWRKAYDLDDFETRLLQLASFSFDVFFGDVCKSLLIGGTMVICPDQAKFDFRELYLLIKKYRINMMDGTPGYVMPLMNYIEKEDLEIDFMKVLLIGGENLNAQWYQHFQATYGSKFRITNGYGTTETTVDSTFYEGVIKKDIRKAGNGAPIGKPYANTLIYILDENRNLQPVGVSGEIYIGGPGVARGYLNRPELTAEKFIKNPFADGRIYRTGDLGRWDISGNVEYLGRADHQVKIRGYRIELGEIESAILNYPGISDVQVIVWENKENEKRLIAYYTSDDSLAGDINKEIKQYLAGHLPKYMVPNVFVRLASFPLTPNGKLDRKALPDPDLHNEDTLTDDIAPHDEIELLLIEIWKKLLTVKKVRVDDNFFDLGGHSIAIMRIITQVQSNFGVTVSIRNFFDMPTVRLLARFIKLNKQDKEVESNDYDLIRI